jgi:hypothetical protein
MSDKVILGILMKKIAYWSHRYQFSFQFWGEDNNNVFIYKDDVELESFGDENMNDILEKTIEWCEKAWTYYKYPAGLEITNPQP